MHHRLTSPDPTSQANSLAVTHTPGLEGRPADVTVDFAIKLGEEIVVSQLRKIGSMLVHCQSDISEIARLAPLRQR